MKRCPECGRDYNDDSMSFCLDDGSELLFGPTSAPAIADEPATAILHEVDHLNEAVTRTQIHVTGNKSDPPATSEETSAAKTVDKRLLVIPLALAILVAGAFVGYRFLRPAAKTPISSIAVLPFENRGGDADIEYLTDGMAETLISSLTRLPDLDVKPRSTVFRYKGKEMDPKSIGKELNVQAVLSGSVVQRGQDISLFVELIDTSLDKAIWSETYSRKQTDLVSLQTEIARDVSGKIKTKLSGTEIAKVSKYYTSNPEAYQLYLKGNFYRTKYTEDGYKKGIEYYEQAIALDPNYALPYHGIAAAYEFANGWYLPARESMPKARAAALKALELDETLAETHYLLAKIAFWYEWVWAATERESKRANQLDPNFPDYYPVYLAAIGRGDEAIKMQEFVQQRSPLDLNVNLDSASLLKDVGRLDESFEQTRRALELDPNFWWSHQNLGLVYERKKQYPEAIAALEKARLMEANASNIGYLGYVYGAAGKKAEALRVLEDLKDLSGRRYVSPYNFALIYSGLGDRDEAFAWLERAIDERSYEVTLLKVETALENLHSDPRFTSLLKRLNLPE